MAQKGVVTNQGFCRNEPQDMERLNLWRDMSATIRAAAIGGAHCAPNSKLPYIMVLFYNTMINYSTNAVAMSFFRTFLNICVGNGIMGIPHNTIKSQVCPEKVFVRGNIARMDSGIISLCTLSVYFCRVTVV